MKNQAFDRIDSSVGLFYFGKSENPSIFVLFDELVY